MGPESNVMTAQSGTVNRKKIYQFPVGIYFILVIHALRMVGLVLFRTIMPLYFTNKLDYSESKSIQLYHMYIVILNILPIFGGIAADNWFGDFYTIIVGFFVLSMGQFVITVTSIEQLHLPMRYMTFTSIIIMAIGFAGESPCLYSFQGNQFILPEESKILTRFYYLIYYWINVVNLITSFLTPLLREDVQCFGEDTCYALPFLLAGITQALCIVVFIAGKSFYIIKKAEVYILVKVVKCVYHAITQRRKLRKTSNNDSNTHWLDYASDKYDVKLINDIKLILRVLIVYTPIPLYFSLYTQQYSSWTYMAGRMDGDIGFRTLLPDQMHLLNPIIILTFIPIIKIFILPYLGKRNILTKLLDQITIGLILVTISYFVLAILQVKLESENPTLPTKGQAQLRIYNGLSCKVKLNSDQFSALILPLSMYENTNMRVQGNESFSYNILVYGSCGAGGGSKNISKNFNYYLHERDIIGHFITLDGDNKVGIIPYADSINRYYTGLPIIRNLVTTNKAQILNLSYHSSKYHRYTNTSSIDFLKKLKPNKYKITVDDRTIGSVSIKLGGVYTAVISFENPETPKLNLITITTPNTVHMLWMLIPYLILTVGEIWIAVPSIEFSYTQAPTSMKSVMQAVYSLLPAVGNMLIILFEEVVRLESQAIKFFMWSILMLAALIAFTILARRYQYQEIIDESIRTTNVSGSNTTTPNHSIRSNETRASSY